MALEPEGVDADGQPQPGRIEIWIPAYGGDECDLQRLVLIGTFAVTIGPDGGPAQLDFDGVLPAELNRDLSINLSGVDRMPLPDLMAHFDVEPTVDLDGDGVADGWRFAFRGAMAQVRVVGNLEAGVDIRPCE